MRLPQVHWRASSPEFPITIFAPLNQLAILAHREEKNKESGYKPPHHGQVVVAV